MPSVLPPLNALRAFKVASRTGSFTAAADELCVSQGAVSRHIAKLEDYLGVALFDRDHREVRLTEVGAAYAAELQRAFDHIEQATHNLYRRKQRQCLKVGVFPTLSTSPLMRRLAEFQAAHPYLDLAVTCKTDFSDQERRELDVAAARGPLSDPTLEYRPIFEIALRPVCTESLLAGRSAIGRPDDLRNCITLHSINRRTDWDTWLAHAGAAPLSPGRLLTFENSALAYQAASAGVGVAMAITDISADVQSAAHLVEPFPLTVRTGQTYGMAWLKTASMRPQVRAFREWLDEVFAAPPPLSTLPHRSGSEPALT